jgi:hypothetical protein
MSNYCPGCGEPSKPEHSRTQSRFDEQYEAIEFVDILILCQRCKYSFNCVGSKPKN